MFRSWMQCVWRDFDQVRHAGMVGENVVWSQANSLTFPPSVQKTVTPPTGTLIASALLRAFSDWAHDRARPAQAPKSK
jgi:hypothetical protein